MAAHDNMNKQQFKLTHSGVRNTSWVNDDVNQYSEPYHSQHMVEGSVAEGQHMLEAHTGNGKHLGVMTWGNGVVKSVNVNENWQRKGMATQMWNRANEITPGLSHSNNRTDAGEGWAKSVGGPRPHRMQDD